ncbi:MAG: MarR family winged helix-turn-helix transcriptional regulator [Balneola sp.]
MSFKNIESFNPSTCISGKVMRLNRITGNIFRKYLSPFGITDSQTSIMFVMSKHEDGLIQNHIATIVQLEKSSLSRNLKRLIDQGYVQKNDSSKIVITHEGKKLIEQVIPEWQKAMDEIRSYIGQDGEEALSTLLNNLINHK